MRSKRYAQRHAAMEGATETMNSKASPPTMVDVEPLPAEPSIGAEAPHKKSSTRWVVAFVLFVAIASAFVMRQAEVMSVQKNLAALEQEIERYEALNESLQAQIDALESDEYIEKAAREKLGLVMPGEVQYMVVDYSGGE